MSETAPPESPLPLLKKANFYQLENINL